MSRSSKRFSRRMKSSSSTKDGSIFIAIISLVWPIISAESMIDDIVREAKVGEIFEGKVTRVEDYGAFVNLFGDCDGLCHVSRLDWKYINNANDVVKVGDTLKVVVIGLDEKGKVKVSHREFLDKPEGYVERPERPAGDRPHGRLNAAKSLMTVIQAYNPDQIVLLGDYLYNGPRNGVPSDYDPMAVCDLLNVYANKIIGVRGNCDSRIDETLLRFKLDDSKIVFLNGYRCNLIHGDLLSGDLVTVTRGDILMFGHTHVGARVVSHTIGPSVTRYDIQTDPSVSVTTIGKYVQDISVRLGGVPTRFEEMVRGKSTSGLEIANHATTIVSLREMLEHLPKGDKNNLVIPFGKSISGDYVFADLSDFPHMLVGGTTGSGKSIFMGREYTSISQIQREFGVGFPRAGKIFAQLQKEGIVALQTESNSSSKGCRVLVHSDPNAKQNPGSTEQTDVKPNLPGEGQ